MNAEELNKIFAAANKAEKYVWLKSQFDPNPLHREFFCNENGTINSRLYLPFIDDYEGTIQLTPDRVEWAHVSTQTSESAMRDRLATAKSSQTLVRLHFANLIEPTLIKHDYFQSHAASKLRTTVMFGYFVQDHTYLSAKSRSRILLSCLLDIENTDISNSKTTESLDFFSNSDDPHLTEFDESRFNQEEMQSNKSQD